MVMAMVQQRSHNSIPYDNVKRLSIPGDSISDSMNVRNAEIVVRDR
jgi:hypothetical protein